MSNSEMLNQNRNRCHTLELPLDSMVLMLEYERF
jgi:hypothetical protein